MTYEDLIYNEQISLEWWIILKNLDKIESRDDQHRYDTKLMWHDLSFHPTPKYPAHPTSYELKKKETWSLSLVS